MVDLERIGQQFLKRKAGALFIKDREEKLKIAFRLCGYVSDKVDYFVLVAPKCFLDDADYVKSINCFSGDLFERIFTFSVEDFSQDDFKYLQLHELAEKYKICCVVDEGLSFKNVRADKTKRLLTLTSCFYFKLIISEAPLARGLIDLYAQVHFLNPSILNVTQTQFIHNYLDVYSKSNDVVKWWSTPEKEKKLVEIIKSYILLCDSRCKLDVRFYSFDFELTHKEQYSYQQEKEAFLKGRKSVLFMQVVQPFQYFYTICEQKVLKMFSLLDDIKKRNEKVIVYTKYLSEICFLKESGVLSGRSFVVMSGHTNKLRALNRFENDVDIMLCTYKVESPRTIIHGCKNIVYFSQTFDYKDKMKTLSCLCCEDGFKVNIYDFWVKTRLESLIRENLSRKKSVLSNVCKMMAQGEALDL